MTGSVKVHKWCLVRTLLLLAPAAASAQEADVARRSYPFLDDRLVVQVTTEAPGELRVVRGERGKVEVAGRADKGFVHFGLGGEHTRQLRLSAAGGGRVQYVVVVPEHVRLTVQLPAQGGGDLSPRQPTAHYTWGDGAAAEPLLPPRPGLAIAHTADRPPAVLDVPDLSAVRSLSVRFEGSDFRISASRPLQLERGTVSGVSALMVAGEPTDIVIYVPPRATFALRSGPRRLVSASGGQPSTTCDGVAVQRPTAGQVWFTFYPQAGFPACR